MVQIPQLWVEHNWWGWFYIFRGGVLFYFVPQESHGQAGSLGETGFEHCLTYLTQGEKTSRQSQSDKTNEGGASLQHWLQLQVNQAESCHSERRVLKSADIWTVRPHICIATKNENLLNKMASWLRTPEDTGALRSVALCNVLCWSIAPALIISCIDLDPMLWHHGVGWVKIYKRCLVCVCIYVYHTLYNVYYTLYNVHICSGAS